MIDTDAAARGFWLPKRGLRLHLRLRYGREQPNIES